MNDRVATAGPRAGYGRAMTSARILAVLLLVFTALPAAAAPKAEPWARWAAHDDQSTLRVDHGAWDAFLAKYLRVAPPGPNRVAYGAVTPADKAALAAYVDTLAAVRVDGLGRAEQMAYWINLYNALTVKVVLDHWSVASIRDIDISPGLFADGPWGAKLVAVQGLRLSLDDIEHRILRPLWRDPRVHYAVNCASTGCPDLAPRAFTADRLEAMLNAGAVAYVNAPRGVRFDGDRLVVSKIYYWFADDFAADGGVLAHLRKHAAADLRARLKKAKEINDYDYDWAINAAP